MQLENGWVVIYCFSHSLVISLENHIVSEVYSAMSSVLSIGTFLKCLFFLLGYSLGMVKFKIHSMSLSLYSAGSATILEEHL